MYLYLEKLNVLYYYRNIRIDRDYISNRYVTLSAFIYFPIQSLSCRAGYMIMKIINIKNFGFCLFKL